MAAYGWDIHGYDIGGAGVPSCSQAPPKNLTWLLSKTLRSGPVTVFGGRLLLGEKGKQRPRDIDGPPIVYPAVYTFVAVNNPPHMALEVTTF